MDTAIKRALQSVTAFGSYKPDQVGLYDLPAQTTTSEKSAWRLRVVTRRRWGNQGIVWTAWFTTMTSESVLLFSVKHWFETLTNGPCSARIVPHPTISNKCRCVFILLPAFRIFFPRRQKPPFVCCLVETWSSYGQWSVQWGVEMMQTLLICCRHSHKLRRFWQRGLAFNNRCVNKRLPLVHYQQVVYRDFHWKSFIRLCTH